MKRKLEHRIKKQRSRYRGFLVEDSAGNLHIVKSWRRYAKLKILPALKQFVSRIITPGLDIPPLPVQKMDRPSAIVYWPDNIQPDKDNDSKYTTNTNNNL